MAGVASVAACSFSLATESIRDSSGLRHARLLKFLYGVNNSG
jgi:hypothetical protein